tara:strand:- start:141 stop:1286 length:1146 start_codon:yes stop_codon:yes gene_type:complete
MQLTSNKNEVILNNEERERYKRHLSLKECGEDGQIRLKKSSAIFIGAGGLGSSAIMYVAAAGIGKIGIADNDKVEISNLQRQVIHNNSEIGNYKTDSAERRIKDLNPHCIVKTFTKRINRQNVLEIIKQFDIVCDCSDNFGTRYLINDACIILNKPLIYGSVQGFEGQVSVFNLKKNSPNFRDLLPKPPEQGFIPSCADNGVIGISPGIIGVLQANEIIKIVIKKGKVLDGKILVYNLLENSIKKLNLSVSKQSPKINNLIKNTKDYESEIHFENIKTISHIRFKKIYQTNLNEIIIFDVREKDEFEKFAIKGSISLPLSLIKEKKLFEFIKTQSAGKKIYTLCQKGIRSELASKLLLKEKIDTISIEGGIEKIGNINNLN